MNPIDTRLPASDAHEYPGYLIAVEGIDGTGKSTLVEKLAGRLWAENIDAVRSFEPTQGKFGKKLRELAASGREDVSPQDELGLFISDRREHLDQIVLPALKKGRVVLLDRYFYSTIAYQGARGLDPKLIEKQNRAFAPLPDLLIILELDLDQALERIQKGRGQQLDEFEKREYLEEVGAIFKKIKHPNLLRLDAGRPTEKLIGQIMNEIPARYRSASKR